MGWIRSNWGKAYCLIFVLVGFIKLLNQSMPAHYRIFTGAAKALWMGQNPYGTDFGTSLGFYFYSPSCALFFFGPFAYLPEKMGLFLYMFFSLLLFCWGVNRLSETLKLTQTHQNWLWFVLTGPVLSAIVASKIEMFMVGVLLICSHYLLSGKKSIVTAFVLGMLLNWKMQILPTVGLLAIAHLTTGRNPFWVIGLANGFIVWTILPILRLDPSFIVDIHRSWYQTLSPFIERDWLYFDHIFKSLANGWQITFSLDEARMMSLGVGLSFCLALIFWNLAMRPNQDAKIRFNSLTLLSLALGATFTCVFSPLNQNNGYIIASPLFMVGFGLYANQFKGEKGITLTVLIVSWAILTLPYSDLCPQPYRDMLRHVAIKPWGLIHLGGYVMVSNWMQVWRKENYLALAKPQ